MWKSKNFPDKMRADVCAVLENCAKMLYNKQR